MHRPLRVLLALLLAGAAHAAERLPPEVARFVARRELCEHFRQEPWPEGATPAAQERREFLARQLGRHCTGSDRALAALKAKYRAEPGVRERLEAYETPIEAHP